MDELESPTPDVDTADELDRFLPPGIRVRFEERYWRPIERATLAESFLSDPAFLADPFSHPATFSDHGVVHVRDVARRSAQLAVQLDGGLLPSRPEARRATVQGLAVAMAYLHDIGMVAATPAGRRVHAQVAAQTALGEGFDDLADDLWSADAAGLRTRIEAADLDRGPVPGPVVLRETLALSLAHSKSVVPARLLDDPSALRGLMLRATFTSLERQMGLEPSSPPSFVARYGDVEGEAFAWLVDQRDVVRQYVADVVAAVRVLRAADALRQRGTTQRTSAGYEICTDQRSGRAVMAMRSADRRFGALMWVDNQHAIAESNLRIVDLTVDGSLRVAFHRGDFSDEGVTERVAMAIADTIADVEADALGSFRPAPGAPRSAGLVEVAPPHDQPDFGRVVIEALATRHPHLADRTVLVDEPHAVPSAEVADWFRRGVAVALDDPDVDEWFDHFAVHGLDVATIDRREALRDARRCRLRPGELVLSAGTAASVVVIPLGVGTRVEPIGGYRSEPLHPWLPIGVTGVVRGAERNAAVIAEMDVDVLGIPAERYLSDWFRPYTPDELVAAWQRWCDDPSGGRRVRASAP